MPPYLDIIELQQTWTLRKLLHVVHAADMTSASPFLARLAGLLSVTLLGPDLFVLIGVLVMSLDDGSGAYL